MLGVKPVSWMICCTRLRVASETPPRPLRTKDTAVVETPAMRAISRMVNFSIFSLLNGLFETLVNLN